MVCLEGELAALLRAKELRSVGQENDYFHKEEEVLVDLMGEIGMFRHATVFMLSL